MKKIAKVLIFIFILCLFSGCYQYVYRDNQNDLVRQDYSSQIKNTASGLTLDQKNILLQDIKSIKYAFNRNDETYRVKMVNIKSKYTQDINQNFILSLLDIKINENLLTNNRIECKHIIEITISLLQ